VIISIISRQSVRIRISAGFRPCSSGKYHDAHRVSYEPSLLAQVSPDYLAYLTAFGKFLRPHDGEVIIAEGSAQDSLDLILSGTVYVISYANERPLLLASLSEGDFLGEINLFDPAAASGAIEVDRQIGVYRGTRRYRFGTVEVRPVADFPRQLCAGGIF
jgi:CRP-like cAMP-binding protein